MTSRAKTAVITGASRGIGAEISARFVAAGFKTWMLARNSQRLNELAENLGPLAIPLVCDLSCPNETGIAIAEIQKHTEGSPDIVVNNAGIFTIAHIEDTEPDLISSMMQLNVLSPFRFIHSFLPVMKSRGNGHVISIGSVADRSAFPGNAAYSASKFAARGIHEVLRQEIQGTGVRATLVSPAATDTSIWDVMDPDNNDNLPSRQVMLKAGDVADSVLWAALAPMHVNIDEIRLSFNGRI